MLILVESDFALAAPVTIGSVEVVVGTSEQVVLFVERLLLLDVVDLKENRYRSKNKIYLLPFFN